VTNVTNFPRHYLARCDRDGLTPRCLDGTCVVCGGGLAYCHTCGGAEGSLPTDCPGERMTELREQLVYDGVLDYVRGCGWVRLHDGVMVSK
jgi:hypothetical protein